MSEQKKEPETLIAKAKKARFTKLPPSKEVVDVVALTSQIDLELWSDGSLTWAPTKQEEEQKDGD